MATTRLMKTVRNFFDLDGSAVGYDTGMSLPEDHDVPFRFNGLIGMVKTDAGIK